MIKGMDSQPVASVQWIDRNELYSNDYNPNHVAPPELKLLKLSIMTDGWTQPIVARDDGQIVDGFHRWLLSADPEISGLTGGMVPVVRLSGDPGVEHQMMATIRHNRARGTHRVLQMADIVVVLAEHMTVKQIMKSLGMEKEEVERLCDTSGSPNKMGSDTFNKGWVPVEG